MSELNIKDYINRELSSPDREIALKFVRFLEERNLTFYRHSLIMEDGTVIPMEHIMEMDGEVFEERAE